MYDIYELDNNEQRAVVISQLFGVQMPIRYTDRKWVRMRNTLIQRGYYDIEKETNLDANKDHKYIERYMHMYGFDFDKFLRSENKANVKLLVDELVNDKDSSFEELRYKYNLMTIIERHCYESELAAKNRPDDKGQAEPYTLDDLLPNKSNEVTNNDD